MKRIVCVLLSSPLLLCGIIIIPFVFILQYLIFNALGENLTFKKQFQECFG